MTSTVKPILRSRSETVARDVTLTDGADVILASGGTVRLGPGFRVEQGGKLEVYTDPDLSNPLRSSMEIRFDLPKAANVTLEVYDMLGRRVARLAEGQMEAGYHRVRWNATHVSSGTYLLRMNAGDFVATETLVLIR